MDKIINIAVVAHVDAGKSTLVDALLKQNGVFKAHEDVGELIMVIRLKKKEALPFIPKIVLFITRTIK